MPPVYLAGYGDSSINFPIDYWIGMTEQTDSHRIRCDLLQMIDRATEKAGIQIPWKRQTTTRGFPGPK